MRHKWDDLQVWTKCDITATLWRDKCNVHMSTNIDNAPAEGNFCNDNRKATKPQISAECNRHMDYVDKGGGMANSYSTNHCAWKWTKKLFFQLLNLALQKSHILLSSCGSTKISNTDFRLTIVRNLLAQAE